MSARLQFTSDDPEPTIYDLDRIAGINLDTIRRHPDATVTLEMPARDRAQAVAFLRLALSVLDPTPKGETS